MLQGDTVMLKVHFKDFKGNSIDPTEITLTTYDNQENQIESFTLDDTNKENVGVYFYEYTLPDDKQEVIFEFRGLHYQKPILVRDKVEIKFI